MPAAAAAAASPLVAASPPVDATLPPPTDLAAARDRRRSVLVWVGAVAAAVVLSVVATTFLVGSRVDDRLAAQDQAIEDLAAVTTATLHVTAEPDVERVALAGTSGTPTTGRSIYSPSTTELVVVATGLTQPPAGQEYHCWVLVDGQRQNIGKMFFGGGLAYWVGPSPAVADLPDDGDVRRLARRCRRHDRRARPGPRLGDLTRDGVGGRGIEIRPVQHQQALGRLGRDVVALLAEDRREPQRLARQLLGVDVGLAPAGVGDDEPHQAGARDEPDDEQPPIELGVHRGRV